MRIHKKVIIIICAIFILYGFTSNQVKSKNEDNIKLYAGAALLMDASNGRVLWEENGYEQRAMASTTKIMTCIIAIENANLGDIVTVSRRATTAPEVKLHIKSGERYKLGDLLYALMLESSNDVAIAIAEHVAGSVEEFCNMMNEKAYDIGAYNTSYKTVNGLDAEGHYTTAYDLALISRYAIGNPEFIRITNTPSATLTELNNNRPIQVNNKNRFLDMMEGAIGVKTGFTCKAGYCFVGSIKKDNKCFISVVLASGWPPNRNYKWQDTMKIMQYALSNYDYVEILNNNIDFKEILIDNGKVDSVDVYFEGTLGMLLNPDEKVRIEYSLPDILPAPVMQHQIIGYLTVFIDEVAYRKYPIRATDSIEKIDYPYCWDIIIKDFWLFKQGE